MQKSEASKNEAQSSEGVAMSDSRGAETKAAASMKPALTAQIKDLNKLRHDFPVVLLGDGEDEPLRSLTAITNDLLRRTAPRGNKGERMRLKVLAVEQRIREAASAGRGGSLGLMWDEAAKEVAAAGRVSEEDRRKNEACLAQARAGLTVDGDVIGFGEDAPARVVAHCWERLHKEQASAALEDLGELIDGLEKVRRVDLAKSDDARAPEALQGAVGPGLAGSFDFSAMSGLLDKRSGQSRLSGERMERIERSLEVMRTQRFFPGDSEPEAYGFTFKSCGEALAAYRERLPALVELAKAVRVAVLEIEGRYEPEVHDTYFESFSERSLTGVEIAGSASYLVLPSGKLYTNEERGGLIEALASDLPIKVLFAATELFDPCPACGGHGNFTGWEARLGAMAASLGTAFVVQTAASQLRNAVPDVMEALQQEGPALMSVYVAPDERFPALDHYLAAAAAAESRAFPYFVFDPSGHTSQARFRVGANPQPEAMWPVHTLYYEDEDLQGISAELPFTILDLMACDVRLSCCFEPVTTENPEQVLVPAGELLELDEEACHGKRGYVLMVDGDCRLQKVAVGCDAIRLARRCADLWRDLQERSRILAPPEPVAEEQPGEEEHTETEESAAPTAPAPKPGEGAESEERSTDDPFVDTPQCSSCDECIEVNDKMFAYNDDKQAYIKNLGAGTYRDLVEAAERCKVAIIQPGKPQNLNEPGLDELIKRAEAL